MKQDMPDPTMSRNPYYEGRFEDEGAAAQQHRLEMAAKIDDLTAQLAAMTAERDEARKFGEHAAGEYNKLLAEKRILRCAFCDTEYPPDTPPSQSEALTAHVKVCPQHPMRAVEAERDALIHDIERHIAIVSEVTAERDRLREAARKLSDFADRREHVTHPSELGLQAGCVHCAVDRLRAALDGQ